MNCRKVPRQTGHYRCLDEGILICGFWLKNQLITEFKITDWLRLSGGVTFNAYGDENRSGERVTSGTDYQDKVNKAWYRFGFGYVAGIRLY